MDTGEQGGMLLTARSTCSRRICEGVSDEFPAGLRVLVVDDDPICLLIMEKMLKSCQYEGNFYFILFFFYLVWVFI